MKDSSSGFYGLLKCTNLNLVKCTSFVKAEMGEITLHNIAVSLHLICHSIKGFAFQISSWGMRQSAPKDFEQVYMLSTCSKCFPSSLAITIITLPWVEQENKMEEGATEIGGAFFRWIFLERLDIKNVELHSAHGMNSVLESVWRGGHFQWTVSICACADPHIFGLKLLFPMPKV